MGSVHCLPTIIAALLGCATALGPTELLADDPPPHATENVILVTLDGLRWQEVFSGAEESLLDKERGGCRDVDATRERFWRTTSEDRRSTLMPFFWGTIAAQGRVFGNPDDGCVLRVTNGHNFSYPGYNELLTGFADSRIDSNDKRPNPNVTVLEWLHRRPGYDGRVAAFCSWDVFPFIINAGRSGIPVDAGWQPATTGPDPQALAALNDWAAEVPHQWENVRYDVFTHRAALEYIKVKQPRVIYISLGETDDWAHARRYDLYLDAAQRADRYIDELWNLLQSLPRYAGKTSLVLTTDHGRGETGADWISHGADIPGSEFMWAAVLGPDAAAAPAVEGTFTQSQIAATVAELLGEDYCAAAPQAAQPLPVLQASATEPQ
jgi:hypothetical protein